MKPVRFLFYAGMPLALLVTFLAACSPFDGPLDAPTAAIRRIRTELGLPQLPLEEIGSATMINSPSGNEAVINYQDAEGRIYSYDPVLNQVIEIDARARLSKIPTDASALPLIELRNEAKKFATATASDFNTLAGQLKYEEGNKGDNYFFSWSLGTRGNTFMPPFLQIALYKNGELFAYINTLALK
jgi:hypothetical protein